MPAPKKTGTTPAKKTTAKAPKARKDVITAPVEETPIVDTVNEGIPNPVLNQDSSSKNIYLLLGIIIVAIAIALLLFSQKQVVPGTPHLKSTLSVSTSTSDECKLPEATIDSSKVVENGKSIKVNYIGKLEDGSIFDSSIEACAKKTSKYSPASGRTFEPLGFTVGQGQMIKGFDAGVVGMKLGESKTITIAPKDAYGESTMKQSVEAKYLKDNFEQEVPAESFNDVIVKSFPKEMMGEKQYKVGEVIDSGGLKGKVTAVTSTGVTISITNTQNPFFGKKIIAGLKGEYQGNEITVKKVTKDIITVNVNNKQSPFYGKEIKPGLTGKLPNGSEVKIVSFSPDGSKAEVEIPNTRELAGKTLIFEVQISQID